LILLIPLGPDAELPRFRGRGGLVALKRPRFF
jgi:hypothetical protein